MWKLINCFLLTVLALPVLAKKTLPQPLIEAIEPQQIARGKKFKIIGANFIKGFPAVHKVIVKNSKNKKYKLTVLNAEKNALLLKAPNNLPLGDYQIKVKLKSRLLRSKASKSPRLLQLRPAALEKPKLNFTAISKMEEIMDLLDTKEGVFYQYPENLELGLNKITSHYYKDDYKSIASEASYFYFLPHDQLEEELELLSESPLEVNAVTKLNQKYDVSQITEKEIKTLSKHFFLKTPRHQRYLERVVQLSPVYIKKLHVKAPESVVIMNRSAESFSFANCQFFDSLKKRYDFATEDLLEAKQEYKIEANLGLNDASADSLTLRCEDRDIDTFAYEKLDASGFAIKLF